MRPDRPDRAPDLRPLARLFALLALWALFAVAPGSAWAQATSARVLYYGDFISQKSSALIQVGPGTGFGLDVVPEGGSRNDPMVLEVRVTPPGEAGSQDPVVFLVAGRVGQTVRLAYRFAYDWEIQPGTWTMEVLCDETRLTGAVFVVSKAPAGANVGNTTSGFQMDKLPDPRPDKVRGKPAAKTPDKTADHQADKAQGHPATTQDDSGRSPSPKSPASGKASQHRIVVGPSERRVYVVMGGIFSEEGRALWMAAFLKGQGATPCVRRMDSGGRRRWGVVLGWRDTLEQAKRLRDDMARIAKDVGIVPMSAGELEEGLACK